MAKGAYSAKKNGQSYEALSEKFEGLKILSVTGMDGRGKPVNVYTAQWIDTQEEDYAVGRYDGEIITENVDIEVTFIISDKYAANKIDVRKKHDEFIAYICGGDLYIKSDYEGKEVHCVCTEDYKPATTLLNRQRGKNYMMGTIKLHTLAMPDDSSHEVTGEYYIGFGASSLGSVSDIENLTNVQHYTSDDAAGDYRITAATTSYLWICTTNSIAQVTSSNFEVPMEPSVQIGDFYCYRSSNDIISGLMEFTIHTN